MFKNVNEAMNFEAFVDAIIEAEYRREIEREGLDTFLLTRNGQPVAEFKSNVPNMTLIKLLIEGVKNLNGKSNKDNEKDSSRHGCELDLPFGGQSSSLRERTNKNSILHKLIEKGFGRKRGASQ